MLAQGHCIVYSDDDNYLTSRGTMMTMRERANGYVPV